MKKRILLFILLTAFFSSCNLLDGRKKISRIHSEKDLQKYLLYGWNHWDNQDLLSYVFMPDGLSLRITFRDNQGQFSSSCYSLPALPGKNAQDSLFKITPLFHAYDGTYSEMILEWRNLKATLQTATHGDNIYILYTPEKLPEYIPDIILQAGMLWNNEGKVEKKDQFIQVDLGMKSFGIGATLKETGRPFPVFSPTMSFRSDTILAFYTGKKRDMEYIHRFVNNRKKQFQETFIPYGEFADTYEGIHSLLAWNTIYDPINQRALVTENRRLNEKWGGWILNSRNTLLNSVLSAVDNKFLSFSGVIATTGLLNEKGYIPAQASSLALRQTDNRVMPPLGAILVKMIYDKYPEEWFLEDIFDNLLAHNQWWAKNKVEEGYFFISRETNILSPDGIPVKNPKIKKVACPDLMGLYVADCKALSDLASILGREKEKEELDLRAEKFAKKTESLWNKNTGEYENMDIQKGVFIPNRPAEGYLPLLAGIPSQSRAENMIAKELLSSLKLSTSLSDNNSPFRSEETSLTNPGSSFFLYLGLKNYILPEACSLMAVNSLRLFLNEWDINRNSYSNYGRMNMDSNPPSQSGDFTPQGALFALIPLMENGYWDKNPDFEKYY